MIRGPSVAIGDSEEGPWYQSVAVHIMVSGPRSNDLYTIFFEPVFTSLQQQLSFQATTSKYAP